MKRVIVLWVRRYLFIDFLVGPLLVGAGFFITVLSEFAWAIAVVQPNLLVPVMVALVAAGVIIVWLVSVLLRGMFRWFRRLERRDP